MSIARAHAADRAWISLALFGGGVAAAVVSAIVHDVLSSVAHAPVGAVELWAADRDGLRVFGLDGDGLVARTIDVASPLALASAGAHGVWVVHAVEPRASAAHCLDLYTLHGARAREIALEVCVDIAADADGRALVVERTHTGSTRAWRIAHDGAPEKLLEAPELASIAPWPTTRSAHSIAVGARTGALFVVDESGVRRFDVGLAGDDIAAPGGAAGLFMLDAREPARLARVDEHGLLAWTVPIGFGAHELAAVDGGASVWIAESGGSRARRFGDDGALELECPSLSQAGVAATLAAADGGVSFAVPGAILRCGARGEARPGQGGFHTLVALARR